MLNIHDYIDARTYKALTVICERLGKSVSDMIPSLKLCFTNSSKYFYMVEGDNDKVLFSIDDVGNFFDENLNFIDIGNVKINQIDRSFNLNKMTKKKSEIIVITFK